MCVCINLIDKKGLINNQQPWGNLPLFSTIAGVDCCFFFHLNYYLKEERKRKKHISPKGHLQTPSLHLTHTHTQILDTIYFYIIEIPPQLITAVLE